MKKIILPTISIILFATILFTAPIENKPYKISLISNEFIVKPNEILNIEIIISIEHNWTIYAHNQKITGKPLNISIQNKNIEDIKINYPVGIRKHIVELNESVNVYTDKIKIPVSFKIKNNAEKFFNVTIKIDGLVCNNSCIPINEEYTLNIYLNDKKNIPDETLSSNIKKDTEIEKRTQKIVSDKIKIKNQTELNNYNTNKLPENFNIVENSNYNFSIIGFIGYVLLGILAGICLNFMPCVLPVLSIKVLSFVNSSAGSSKKNLVLNGLIYSAGILLVFTILASMMAFFDLQWGEQFSKPKFIIGMIMIVIFFSMGLFDVFTINISINTDSISTKNKYLNSFLEGILATLLATPCAGPGLGATLGWASSQKPVVIFIVYFSIGIGMALPFFILTLFNSFRRFIPKPGKWMIKFKEFMAFILLGTVIYLISLLEKKYYVTTVYLILMTAFFAWMIGKLIEPADKKKKKIIIRISALIILLFSIWFGFKYLIIEDKNKEVNWINYNEKLFLNMWLNEHKNILVDFTADWCPNCKVNEKLVLESKDVVDIFKKNNIVMMKADKTIDNTEIDNMMRKLNAASIPLLALFKNSDDKKVFILRDVYTKKQFKKFLNNIFK